MIGHCWLIERGRNGVAGRWLKACQRRKSLRESA
jgi:hypothetical protein